MSRNTMKKSFSLKDHLFNEDSVSYLADLFVHSNRGFKKEIFVREVMAELPALELKERIVCIAKILKLHLPSDFVEASQQIIQALPAPLDPLRTDDDFGSFIFAPLGEFIVQNGLHKKHLQTSLAAIGELTQRFSMEDAIRYFINEHQEETLAELAKWSTHTHYHVRRLVSEGTRPLLPWSRRLRMPYIASVPLLDVLHKDPTRYVTRSVANHLNDISKKDPELVLTMLSRWKKAGKQDTHELHWMSRHALRTLVKKGDANALSFLGYTKNPKIRVEHFVLDPTVLTIDQGGILSFSCTITALENAELMVDHVIDFVKAKGDVKSKVFKITKLKLKKGETTLITKKHRLLADATTFKLYGGAHGVSLQINGKRYGSAEFFIA